MDMKEYRSVMREMEATAIEVYGVAGAYARMTGFYAALLTMDEDRNWQMKRMRDAIAEMKVEKLSITTK
jgi:hypothetical protein